MKFHMGYEKHMSFLVISKFPKLGKKVEKIGLGSFNNDFTDLLYNHYCFHRFMVDFFFIPVSSLNVFDHSIHSKRRKIYFGASIQTLQNDTLSHQGIQPTVYVLCVYMCKYV